MGVFLQSYTYRDRRGKAGWLRVRFNTGAANEEAAGLSLRQGLNQVTDAAFNSSIGPYFNPKTPPVFASAGNSFDIDDKARFLFADATGMITAIDVPMPKLSVFLPDRETVNPADGGVFTFITRVRTAAVCGRNGTRCPTFISGYRWRYRTIPRRVLGLKSANLSTPS